MRTTGSSLRSWSSAYSVLGLLLAAGVASASLCVWRQPDADIAGIFGSGSYKTVFVDITRRDEAEDREAARVPRSTPDETQFKFFPVFQGKKQVGTVMTHAGKGQFGAIEVVVAVVPTDSGVAVKEVRIQRDREKAKAALRGDEVPRPVQGYDGRPTTSRSAKTHRRPRPRAQRRRRRPSRPRCASC